MNSSFSALTNREKSVKIYEVKKESENTVKRIITFIILAAIMLLCFSSCAEEKQPPTLKEIDFSEATTIEKVKTSDSATDYVLIDVKDYGKILVRLFPDVAPETVENFKKLVSDKFFDGLIFHRVIEDFMIQGGGYTPDMEERDAKSIKGEFTSNGFTNNLVHFRGVISMARTSVPDSASSQFFIMHKTSTHLDGQYAAFGYTVYGMDVVDEIASVRTDANDQPRNDVVISSIRFADVSEVSFK